MVEDGVPLFKNETSSLYLPSPAEYRAEPLASQADGGKRSVEGDGMRLMTLAYVQPRCQGTLQHVAGIYVYCKYNRHDGHLTLMKLAF